MERILKVDNLSFTSKKRKILDNVSFNVPDNSICAFIGPNGAGKTTTIKCITNLYPVYKGNIYVDGISNKNIKSFESLGYVPEKENFPKLKVRDFLWLGAQVNGLNKEKFKEKVKSLLNFFDANEFYNSFLHILSSGEKKKILIIQALLNSPKLIIMDEPTENMDPDSRQKFYKIIINLKKAGKTVFISTHQLDEIKNYIDYAVFIKNGTIQYDGKVKSGSDLYTLFNKLNRNTKDSKTTDNLNMMFD